MNLISISDLRQRVSDIVEQVSSTQEPVTIMKRSKPKAVLVDHEYFTSLEEAVLDLTDDIEAEKAKKEPTISLETHLKRRQSRRSK